MNAAMYAPGSRWSILALLFVCRTGLGLQFQTLGSVSDSLVAALGFSYAEIGTLIGLFMLPGLVLALPAGYLGRKLSDRVLVSLALLWLAAGGLIAALAQGFGWLALGRLACGVGFVFSTIYLTKMTADWFAGKELATAMGILVMSWPLGIALGQIGQVWIDLHIGWPAVFAAAALYCTLAAVAMFVGYRPPPALAPQPTGPIGLPRGELLLTLLAASCWGLYNAGYIVFLSFAPRVLMAGGHGPVPAAAIISLASWAMIFSGAIGGRIADRSGRGALMFYLCCVVGVAALLLLRQMAWAVPLSLVYGLAGGAPAGVIMALTGEAMAPQRRAFGMGVFFSLYFVLLSLGPPLAGGLYDASRDPFVPLQFAVLLFAGAALAFWLFRRLKAGALRTSAPPPAT
jgi:predicted MFS family arabinose efflux permease